MGGARSWTAGLLACVAISSTTAQLEAAPSDRERTRARELVYRGDELFDDARHAEALTAYREADEIMRVPTTGIEVAKTLAVLGRLVEARSIAVTVEQFPASDDEPIPFVEARKRATRLVRELDRRIPSVTLDVLPSAPTLIVRVDKIRVSNDLASAPLRMDPGRHLITVGAAGFEDVTREVDVEEGERRMLRFTLPSAKRSPGPLAIGGLVLSGVALTGGLVTGALYLKERDDLADACTRESSLCNGGSFDRTDALGLAASVSFAVAAGAGVVGGIALGVDVAGDADVAVTARLSPTFVGVDVVF
ncbi:MAG: hypothetical protein HOW73_07790 [Polyangiaceae bacterium]|nr:hypothetical protein [Polyangiaceae bacterium]